METITRTCFGFSPLLTASESGIGSVNYWQQTLGWKKQYFYEVYVQENHILTWRTVSRSDERKSSCWPIQELPASREWKCIYMATTLVKNPKLISKGSVIWSFPLCQKFQKFWLQVKWCSLFQPCLTGIFDPLLLVWPVRSKFATTNQFTAQLLHSTFYLMWGIRRGI